MTRPTTTAAPRTVVAKLPGVDRGGKARTVVVSVPVRCAADVGCTPAVELDAQAIADGATTYCARCGCTTPASDDASPLVEALAGAATAAPAAGRFPPEIEAVVAESIRRNREGPDDVG